MTNTINTEFINYVLEKYNSGHRLTRKEQIFYKNIEGTLKSGYLYAYTNEEIEEYIKCANNLIYFIEKYCKIRSSDDGKLINFKLRNYQKEILKEYDDNRFLIHLNSRQTGSTMLLACIYLHQLLFKNEQGIVSIHNNNYIGVEFIDIIKENYLHLPYFLKQGIRTWNNKNIKFDNYSNIRIGSKMDIFAGNYEIYDFHDFAHIPPNIINDLYRNIYPVCASRTNAKLIISSTPNGKNLFKQLVDGAELKEGHPDKNIYKVIKTYWWEVPGRDHEWKEEQIKMLGSVDAFEQEYDLKFL